MIRVYRSGDAWAVRAGDVLSGAYKNYGKALETAKLIAEPKNLELVNYDTDTAGAITSYNFQEVKRCS